MKISKEQKLKNRATVLETVVRLCKDAKFKDVSMRAIAKESGMSDASIYNYFPSKEEILTGYFEFRLQQAIETATQDSHFAEKNFTEKVQWIFETQLELMEDEEHFVGQAYSHLFEQPIALAQSGIGRSKKQYVDFMNAELQTSVSRGEFREPPFPSFICELLWDVHIGIVYYWLKDSSSQKLNTSQVIELSMDLLSELLSGEVFNKAYSLMHFLVKEHLLSKIFKFGMKS